MATFKEIAYAISDFSKTITDDSTITIEHIIFLMSKYRSYILNSNYSTVKKKVNDANYQTVCAIMEMDDTSDLCGTTAVLRSTNTIPYIMNIGRKNIFPPAGFMYGKIQYVDNNKFKYSGHNPYLKNEIYATIGPDQHLYLKSNNSNFLHLKKVGITAVFNDITEAAFIECNDDCAVLACDILDKRFPLEDSFIGTLMTQCVQDIVGAAWRFRDDTNNANDDLGTLAQQIQNYTTQSFKNLAQGVENRNR